jgi:hypothetical protein
MLAYSLHGPETWGNGVPGGKVFACPLLLPTALLCYKQRREREREKGRESLDGPGGRVKRLSLSLLRVYGGLTLLGICTQHLETGSGVLGSEIVSCSCFRFPDRTPPCVLFPLVRHTETGFFASSRSAIPRRKLSGGSLQA